MFFIYIINKILQNLHKIESAHGGELEFKAYSLIAKTHSCYIASNVRMLKVTVHVFWARIGTLNSNQSKACERVMEFPFHSFNALIKGLSGYDRNPNDLPLETELLCEVLIFFLTTGFVENLLNPTRPLSSWTMHS